MPGIPSMRKFIRLVLAAAATFGSTVEGESPRNLVLILADDLGIGDVSAYRAGDLRTPNIDRLSEDGMLFTNTRANASVCSPTRAAILTGHYPDRVGVPGVVRTREDDSWGWLDPDTPTLADQLNAANYHTALIGKWHLGLESPTTPNERGFNLYHGFLGDMMDSYTDHLRWGNNYMRRNGEIIRPEGHATDLFSDWAIDYLTERSTKKNQPFFLFLSSLASR